MLCRVANDGDPGMSYSELILRRGTCCLCRPMSFCHTPPSVVPLPRQCCAIYPMCGLEYIVMFCLCCFQLETYRHVGLGMQLPSFPGDPARFVHTKIQTNWFRTLCSDWAKLCGRSIILPLHLLCLLVTCTNPTSYRDNHG